MRKELGAIRFQHEIMYSVSSDNNLTNKLGEILPCSKSNYHNC